MSSRGITRKIMVILCVGIALMFMGSISSANNPEEIKSSEEVMAPGEKKNLEFVTGPISMVRFNSISIISHKDEVNNKETEMVFIIDEYVTFKRKNLDELKMGDVVKIAYENYTKLDEEGNDKFVKRVTNNVHFLRGKSKSLSSGKK